MVAVGDTQLQCYEAGSGDSVLLLSGTATGRYGVIPHLAPSKNNAHLCKAHWLKIAPMSG